MGLGVSFASTPSAVIEVTSSGSCDGLYTVARKAALPLPGSPATIVTESRVMSAASTWVPSPDADWTVVAALKPAQHPDTLGTMITANPIATRRERFTPASS